MNMDVANHKSITKKLLLYFFVFSSQQQGTSKYIIYVFHLHPSVTCYHFNLVLQIMNEYM